MVCTSCGGENPALSVRCGHCGAVLEAPEGDRTIDGGAPGKFSGEGDKPKSPFDSPIPSRLDREKNPRGEPESAARASAEGGPKATTASKTPSGFDADDDRTMDGSAPGPILGSEEVPSGGKRSQARSKVSASLIYLGGLEPGMEFGPRFRIEKLLGEGGMGKVYKAYDKEVGRTVALKILQPELTRDPTLTLRFKQELLLASKISHRNILRIHDLSEVDGVKYITMAFIEGRDLSQLLKEERPFPLERSLNIVRQLCGALDAAHSEGVVHRDFKPQNVLIGNDDRVFVSDFGLATSLETAKMGMTRTGAFVGTPRYMAPEQVEGEPADNRTDLYALGLTFYEMVSGELPFSAESTLQVMYQRVNERPKDIKLANPAVPDAVARIIMHCLEKDPANRYQSAKEILADLDAGRSPSLSLGRTVQINLSNVDKRWWYAFGGGIVLLAGMFFALPKTRHWISGVPAVATPAPGAAGLPSIPKGKFVAVLPFRVLGDQSSFGYVADGLVEAMSAKLFQLKDVRLASSTAAAKTDPKTPLSQVAKELGVNLIVHGTVQGSGDNFRVTVNLENVAENRMVWSQEFGGVTGDLLTIEDQIYTRLVDALETKPSNEEMAAASAHPTENIEAYDLYLRGRNAMRGQQEQKNVETAVGFYEQALKKDPKFALAYAGLADASLALYHLRKDRIWSDRALAAAQQAQRLDDKLPEIHFALGGVYSATGRNAEALAELKHALELAPNSDEGYRGLGSAYMILGNKEQALQAYEKAIAINPYYWVNYDALGVACWRSGENDKALEAFRRITELEPDNAYGYMNIGLVYFQQGKYDQSLVPLHKAVELQPDSTSYSNLGTAYFYLKRYSESVQMFEKSVAQNPNDEEALGNLADAYRWSGQKEKAQATYDRAIALAYKELAVNPRSTTTLVDLALYYAKKGESARGLDFIRRARAINKNNVETIYSEAVVDALAGQPKEALTALGEAFRKGYSPRQAENDPELASVQSLPDFEKLVSEFRPKSP